MKSINEGPFHMGTVSDVIAAGTEGAVQQGPVRARVLNDLSAEEKERYKADIRATNILLQGIPKDIYSLINHYTDAKDIWENVKMILEGSELTKDDRESQLYDEFEHFRQIKGETIQGYYVRFTKLINDMRNIKMTMPRMQLNSKFVNNMLPEWSRFITEVKLNRGFEKSNFDQRLYAYMKQHKYPTQSSKSPQSSNEPSPADNFQLDSGSSSTENLFESLSNLLPSSLNRTNHIFLKQTINLERRLMQGTKLRFKTAELWFKMSVEDTMRIIKEDHFRETMQEQMLTRCYNVKPRKMGAVTGNEEQSLFLAGEHVTNFDDDVGDSPENDLALNVDNVFEADECDAFDSDVDKGPTTQTMFMANLTSEDPIYDEAGPSYDSNTPFEMQSDVQHNYVVDSDADYTSDSNIIPYDQYVEDNEDHVVQSNVSSVRNDALISILDEMHEQGVQSRLANKPDMVVNDSVTSELARYKELVGEYEKRAKFELTDRERKIDEQMRIIISDRNRKETSLKSELHSAQYLLSSKLPFGHY
ncbi:hypothetical protein Tco_0475125 [Tanacetum coccineum]